MSPCAQLIPDRKLPILNRSTITSNYCSDVTSKVAIMSVEYHYNQFPPTLEIDDELHHLINQARTVLGRYDGCLNTMHNADVLLSPLFKQEAVLSSRIEGTQSTLTEVLAYEAHEGKQNISEEKKDDIREIINYRMAMQEAEKMINQGIPLSERVLRAAHEKLMQGVRGENKAPGIYRKIPVWIGSDQTNQESARFVPIQAQNINHAMTLFSNYMNHNNDHDDLIKVAILHAEFEAIHPFLDGNGRVGRLFIPLYLWQKGLLVTPSFYISAYFEQHRDSYYDLLLQISAKHDWLSWIKFFTQGIITQSEENFARAESINNYYRDLKDKIPSISKSAYGITALDFIFRETYFRGTKFYEKSGIPRAVAQRLLKMFVEENILECIPGRGRTSNFYIFEKLIDIADGKAQVDL